MMSISNRYLILFLLFLFPLHAASPAAETILVDGVEVLREDYNLFGTRVTGLTFDEVYERISSDKIYEGRLVCPEDLKLIGISSEWHPYSLYAQIMMIYYSSTTDLEMQKLLVYFLSRNMADVTLKFDEYGWLSVGVNTINSLFQKYFVTSEMLLPLVAVSVFAPLGFLIGSLIDARNNRVKFTSSFVAVLFVLTLWYFDDLGLRDAKSFEKTLAKFEENIKRLSIVGLDKKVPNIVTQKFEVLKKELSKIEYIKDGNLDKSLFKDALMLASEFTDDLAGNAFFEASGAVEVE
jgi:hypothetical protein